MLWIKKNKDYFKVFSYRRRYETENIIFHYKPYENFAVGIVVSKKIGNSAVRHKVKRQIKAIFQEKFNEKNLMLVVRIKKKTPFNQMLNEIKYGLRKIERRM